MRHELTFDEWVAEAKAVAAERPEPIIITEQDVHDDWACGYDPGVVVSRIIEGRHRNFKRVDVGGRTVSLSARTTRSHITAQVQALLN